MATLTQRSSGSINPFTKRDFKALDEMFEGFDCDEQIRHIDGILTDYFPSRPGKPGGGNQRQRRNPGVVTAS